MAVWKWSGCLIIYPVVSMQIQTTAQPQAPLSEILGQSLFRPRLPANAHGSQISPWHWKLVLWGAVDFNSQAEQSSRWSMQRGHTSGAVGSSCCLAFWSSKKETELWDMETSAHGNQLADEAGWNSNGRIRLSALTFEISSIHFVPALCPCGVPSCSIFSNVLKSLFWRSPNNLMMSFFLPFGQL